MSLRVAAIQTPLHWEQPDANRAMLEEKIHSIQVPVDVIVLPEMFTTGFSMNTQIAEQWRTITLKWMQNMAAHTQALLLGSVMTKEGGRCYNRLVWMEPEGTPYFYDKRHLFRMAGEHEKYASGLERLVRPWRGWNICPLVCYDLRFPVWSRNRAQKHDLEYDFLIYVANWPAPRAGQWQALLRARAIENQAYCLGVNRVGLDGNGVNYAGNSGLYSHLGEALYEAEDREEIAVLELKKADLEAWRQKFPAWRDADAFALGQ